MCNEESSFPKNIPSTLNVLLIQGEWFSLSGDPWPISHHELTGNVDRVPLMI